MAQFFMQGLLMPAGMMTIIPRQLLEFRAKLKQVISAFGANLILHRPIKCPVKNVSLEAVARYWTCQQQTKRASVNQSPLSRRFHGI
jgi:hypothetical protein